MIRSLLGWKLYLILAVIVGGYVGWLKLSNAHLHTQLDHARTQARHDVAEAHIEEIDLSLVEKLKNIEETHDDNITLSPADYNGVWMDDFGM